MISLVILQCDLNCGMSFNFIIMQNSNYWALKKKINIRKKGREDKNTLMNLN